MFLFIPLNFLKNIFILKIKVWRTGPLLDKKGERLDTPTHPSTCPNQIDFKKKNLWNSGWSKWWARIFLFNTLKNQIIFKFEERASL